MEQATTAKQRKGRALAVLSGASLNSIPATVGAVGFRGPTAAERARGRALGTRAAELLQGHRAAA